MAVPKLTVREAQKNLTYNRLVDAAVELLNRNDALSMTMDDLAKSAAVSRATVYSHFESKVDIMEAIARRLFDSGREAYTLLAEQSVWTRESVAAWFEEISGRYRLLVPQVRALTNAGPASSVRDSTVEVHRGYVDLIAADRGRWGATPVDEVRRRCLVLVIHVEAVGTALALDEFADDTLGDPTDLALSLIYQLLEPALTG